ncbi:DUF3159 domain-containing protein [Nocardioides carbamazepini]|uniref:DUF3159 domain-containing protein n=1 Tax=Nocardioides carbamazepini TaxID=2854259 RepID=UPI002149D582|nr:DUF3159 domain-containing protein [Nocardioides carbamazepini]
MSTPTPAIGVDTVEALVRRQLATALGGRRGMAEAAIPGVVFTVAWLSTKELQWALVGSLVVAGLALLARVVQRSSTQYVLNAVFGIGIGWVFVRWAESSGGSESDQALAFFLPGILMSLGYTVVLGFTCLIGWPMLGFMLGGVTGDPTAWHDDPQVVRLCSRLTWVMLLPGAVGVLLQGPVWLLGHSGRLDADQAVVLILILRTGLGWALRIGSWSLMIWLLARNATPLTSPDAEPDPA